MASPEPSPFLGLIDPDPKREESCGSCPRQVWGQLPLMLWDPQTPPQRPKPQQLMVVVVREPRPWPPLLAGQGLHRQGGQLIGK